MNTWDGYNLNQSELNLHCNQLGISNLLKTVKNITEYNYMVFIYVICRYLGMNILSENLGAQVTCTAIATAHWKTELVTSKYTGGLFASW